MRRDDRRPFLQGRDQARQVAYGLVVAEQAELEAHVGQQRQLQAGQGLIERPEARQGRVEALGVGQDLDQDRARGRAALQLVERVAAPGVDRDAGQEQGRGGRGRLQDEVVGHEQVRARLVEPSGLVVDPVEAQQLRAQPLQVEQIGLLRLVQGQAQAPGHQGAHRAPQQTRRDPAAVLRRGQGRQVHVDVGELSHAASRPASSSTAVFLSPVRSSLPEPSSGNCSTL